MPGQGMMTGVAAAPRSNSRNANQSESGGPPKNLTFLFVLAIFIQVIDVALFHFDRQVFLPTAIAMYLFLAILAAIFFHEKGEFIDIKQLIFFLALSALWIIIPFYLYLVPQITIIDGRLTLLDFVSFFIAWMPIWPIYIGLKAQNPFVHWYVNLWIIAAVIAFIVAFAMQLNAGTFANMGGRPELVNAGNVAIWMMEQIYKTGQNVWQAINPGVIIPRLVNNSGLGYYTGTIERNQKEPVGLYIEQLRLADQYNYVGSPVIIWSTISGKSFTEEIKVVPQCIIDKGIASGVSDPRSFTIFGYSKEPVSCIFSDLPKGSYRAKVGVSFNFETWGYVTYTFVDEEVKRSLEVQGKSINSEYDIDRLARSIYTNGPVMLGMSGMIDQPVGIDTKSNTKEPILGVTLDNVWTDGKLEKVNEFVIIVPDDFKLVKCDRGTGTVESTNEGYSKYTFTQAMQPDPRLPFQSITCRLHINDPARLLGGSQKVQRTIAAVAKYNYHLEKSIGFTVRE